MRGLAARAVSDRAFLSAVRRNPRGALAGYDLEEDEMRAILDLVRRTASLGDGMVAALISGGLRGRGGSAPPGSPGRPYGGPGRPGAPGGPGPPGRRRRDL